MSLAYAWVRDHEVWLADSLVAEYEDVDVDDAWTPPSRRFATSLLLHFFGHAEQLPRAAQPVAFQHLVQKSGLVRNAPRLRFDDATLAQDSESLLT
jgi:hypothetical protein